MKTVPLTVTLLRTLTKKAALASSLLSISYLRCLENDAGTDTEVMIGCAEHSYRVVIELDRSDLEVVVYLDIKAATNYACQTGITERFVRDNYRRADACASKILDLCTGVPRTDHCMSERLKTRLGRIILDLNAAEEVVK